MKNIFCVLKANNILSYIQLHDTDVDKQIL